MKPVWRWTPKCVPSTGGQRSPLLLPDGHARAEKPRGRTIALAFDEGVVGLVGRRAEPINGRCPKPPSFKYVPQVKRIVSDPSRCRSFIGASCWACWWCSSANCASSTKAKSLSWSPGHADGWDLVTVAAQRHFRPVSPNARARAGGFARRGGGGSGRTAASLLDQVYRASTLDTASERERLTALEEAGAEFRRFSKRFAASSQKRARRSSIFILTC